MPVKVIPSINRFCAIIKATIRGTVTVTIEAIIGPNSSLSIPPLNSLIPSGGVKRSLFLFEKKHKK